MKINIKDINIWQPFFDYEGTLLDINIEYGITHHKSADRYSLSIRDAKTDFIIP